MTTKPPIKAIKGLRKIRPPPKTPGLPHEKGPDFGRQIFLYKHVYTNQVLYSLTSNMKNNRAMSQIPFLGKKTVAPALRKDMWAPFAMIEFPNDPTSGAAGLKTFQKLREYRRLHETQWPESIRMKESTDAEKKGEMVTVTKKERGRLLQNQMANSVADMAAALTSTTLRRLSSEELAASEVAQAVPGRENAEGETSGDGKSQGVIGRLFGTKNAPKTEIVPSNSKKQPEKTQSDVFVRLAPEPVIIKWVDTADAGYAEKWPETVMHDVWARRRDGRSPRIQESQDDIRDDFASTGSVNEEARQTEATT